MEAASHKHDSITLLHGQAVAWGMVFAAYLSEVSIGMPKTDRQLIVKCLVEAGCLPKLPEHFSSWGTEKTLHSEVMPLIRQDKKMTTSASSQWVLLESLGNVHQPLPGRYTVEITESQILASWQLMVADDLLNF